MRKQIISQFAGITVDMDYVLCIPSIHARYQQSEIIVDYCGAVREKTGDFPAQKEQLLKQWVALHSREILENHLRCGRGQFPLLAIAPPDPD